MRKFLPLLTVVLSLVMALGCDPSSKDLVGAWTGDLDVADTSMGKPLAPDFVKSLHMELTANADKTFDLLIYEHHVTGTWTLDGNTLRLKIDRVEGKTLDEYAKMPETPGNKKLNLYGIKQGFVFDFNGGTIKTIPKDEDDPVVVFKRKPSH